MTRVIASVLALLLMAGVAVAGEWKKLVGPDDLGAMLGTDIVLLDIRTPDLFAEGHIAGSVNAPYGLWRGPKGNPGEPPSDAALTELLQGLGIRHDDRVVIAYRGQDADDFGAAARVYWTLKSVGLTEIAILNGGLVSWVKSGRIVVNSPGLVVPSDEAFTLSHDWMATRHEVRSLLDHKGQAVLVDARPMSFWRGKTRHPLASRAGTLRDSLQLSFDTWFVDRANEVSSVDMVRMLATKAGYTGGSDRDLVSFCNAGHWSATNWFVLSEVAGIADVKLYPESMVGWTNAGGDVEEGK